MKKSSAYLDAVKSRLVFFDGATGTNLEEFPLTEDDFGGKELLGLFDALPTYAPHWVEKNHRSFLEVGSDVIETDSFRSNRMTLGEFGIADRVYEFNKTAAEVARKVQMNFRRLRNRALWLVQWGLRGNCPHWMIRIFRKITFDEIVSEVYQEQSLWPDRWGRRPAVIGNLAGYSGDESRHYWNPRSAKRARCVAADSGAIHAGCEWTDAAGTNVEAVWSILSGFDIDVIGINCSTGPEHMRDTLRWLGEHSTIPISCLPNAGMPLNDGGKVRYPMTPERFSDYMKEYVEEYGLNVVGGCCGTTAEHIECPDLESCGKFIQKNFQ